MATIIAVVNQKGGVGKTSTCLGISHGLALASKRTLLIDLDPSANASKAFMPVIPLDNTVIDVLTIKGYNINNAIYHAKQRDNFVENLDVIPSRIQLALIDINNRPHREKILARQLEAIKSHYDYIVIDCPPMLSVFTTNAIYAADFIIVPVTYENDALEGVNDLFDIIKDIKEDDHIDYKILRNGLDGRKKSVNAFIEDAISPFLANELVFKTIIQQDEEINKSKIEGETILTFSPKSIGAQNFMELIKELVNNAQDH